MRQSICTKVEDFRLKLCIFAVRNKQKMRLRYFSILLAAFALLLCVSCKKKEETKEYMNGSLKLEHSVPAFVMPGETYTIKVSGVTAPDGTAVGYYYTHPVSGLRDTLKNGMDSFFYEVPDSVGRFTLTFIAFPVESSDKYYVSSATCSFTTVRDGPVSSSITGISMNPGDEVVEIDGRSYYVGKSGGLNWMRSNLATVRRDASGNEVFGRSYMDCKAVQYLFGAYYTWEEAQTACPAGWHLPSDAEWVALLKEQGAPEDLQPLQPSPNGAGKLMAKAYFNGNVMWDYYRDVIIQDLMLSAIPAGYATVSESGYSFRGYDSYAVFWTSDEHDGMGVYRYIFEQCDDVFVATADKKAFAASVRCVAYR